MEGEEATTGINVEKTVYGKKGEVLTVRKYNTLDSASVLCEEKEYAEEQITYRRRRSCIRNGERSFP